MITLKSGVPGSGKTLTAVAELLDAFRPGPWRWLRRIGLGPLFERSDSAGVRVVFTHGIPELTTPTIPLPVYAPVEPRGKGGDLVQVRDRWEVDWSVVPDGALVVVDEAQRVFPVRGAGSTVPGYVSWLNTHRHRGIDLVLITQHPKLIDGAVRKLVGQHQHYRRLLGGQRHAVYEWDHCSETLGNMKQATMRVANFPKRAFSAYKSAEVHTKQRFGAPLLIVGVLVGALVLAAVAAPYLWRVVQGIRSGDGVGGAKTGEAVASASAEPAASAVDQHRPGAAIPADQLLRHARAALPAAVAASSAYPDRWAPSHWPPSIAGCWIDGDECRCMTNGDRPRLVTDGGSMCVQVARGELEPDPSRPKPSPARLAAAMLPSAATAAVEPGTAGPAQQPAAAAARGVGGMLWGAGG